MEKQMEKDVIHPFEFIGGGSGGYKGDYDIGPGGEAIGGSGDVIDDSADFFGMGTGAVIGRTDKSIKQPGGRYLMGTQTIIKGVGDV